MCYNIIKGIDMYGMSDVTGGYIDDIRKLKKENRELKEENGELRLEIKQLRNALVNARLSGATEEYYNRKRGD